MLIEFENEVKVRRNRGVSDRNINRMLRIVEENQVYFQQRWREIYQLPPPIEAIGSGLHLLTKRTRIMVQVQLLKRPLARYSGFVSGSFPLNTGSRFCWLTRMANPSPKRATINLTLISAFFDKFNYSILSQIARNVSAHFTTGFISKLYSGLSRKYK